MLCSDYRDKRWGCQGEPNKDVTAELLHYELVNREASPEALL